MTILCMMNIVRIILIIMVIPKITIIIRLITNCYYCVSGHVYRFLQAKEVLQHWNFLEGWRHAKVEDYMPSDAPEVRLGL